MPCGSLIQGPRGMMEDSPFATILRASPGFPGECLKSTQTGRLVVMASLRARSMLSITIEGPTFRAWEPVRVDQAGTAKEASAAITAIVTNSSVSVRPRLTGVIFRVDDGGCTVS